MRDLKVYIVYPVIVFVIGGMLVTYLSGITYDDIQRVVFGGFSSVRIKAEPYGGELNPTNAIHCNTNERLIGCQAIHYPTGRPCNTEIADVGGVQSCRPAMECMAANNIKDYMATTFESKWSLIIHCAQ